MCKEVIKIILSLAMVAPAAISCGDGSAGFIARATNPGPLFLSGVIFDGDTNYPRCHASTITCLTNGDVLAAWYAGSFETASDVAILLSRLPAGRSEWSPYELVADTPGYSEGNPVLFQAPDGVLWLWYLTIIRPALGWSGCQIKLKKSADNGYTWSEEEIFRKEIGIDTRNHPIVLQNGDWLLPLHEEMIRCYSCFYKSQDHGQTWIKISRIAQPQSLQPTVFQRRDGTLISYMRNPAAGYLLTSVSEDNGNTWSGVTQAPFYNPNSSAEIRKLTSGNIVLALNNTHRAWPGGDRSELSVVYSTQEAQTWDLELKLQDEDCHSFAYPSVGQDADGNILISYTHDRLSIDYVKLNEAYIQTVAP